MCSFFVDISYLYVLPSLLSWFSRCHHSSQIDTEMLCFLIWFTELHSCLNAIPAQSVYVPLLAFVEPFVTLGGVLQCSGTTFTWSSSLAPDGGPLRWRVEATHL